MSSIAYAKRFRLKTFAEKMNGKFNRIFRDRKKLII